MESSHLVVDRAVCVGRHDRHRYAINANPGEERWQYETSVGVRSPPAVQVYRGSGSGSGTGVFGSDDGRSYAVDATIGFEE
jgi:outer membrane protein assembly factor BamB